MDKLQKLLELGLDIQFHFDYYRKGQIYCFVYSGIYRGKKWQFTLQSKNIEKSIQKLWEQAKKHYPDAECFKEEREEG